MLGPTTADMSLTRQQSIGGRTGAIAIAGAGVSWLRDGLGVLESAEQSEELAASVDDAAGVFFVPAFRSEMA